MSVIVYMCMHEYKNEDCLCDNLYIGFDFLKCIKSGPFLILLLFKIIQITICITQQHVYLIGNIVFW